MKGDFAQDKPELGDCGGLPEVVGAVAERIWPGQNLGEQLARVAVRLFVAELDGEHLASDATRRLGLLQVFQGVYGANLLIRSGRDDPNPA